ncbi:SRPBCC domain-containing protein [Verrucosispora sp. WMMA2121]|uniref:SRPBCC domain-containing protein n=1 Tax=Verrucosispora sp. WMMA2121 TaxID=3015164 RepID=UPI0022B5EC09|nr:SRPBCC domain-containing protein [Verrucosispora sp. WMMA2121]MCZ7423655.1 SRPBCC domain-containing protein [Verrucosispora sp. WMMA2121]
MVRHDTFTISRHLDVPPGEVFTAFADTTIRRRWFRLPGHAASYEHDFRVGGGETARSTYTGLDTAPERLEYRSRYIDILGVRRIVYNYEAIIDDQLRWTSLVTVQLDAETHGTRLHWTEQAAFVRYTGDGGTDLAHLRGATVLRLNGLDAALQPRPPRRPPVDVRTGLRD